MKFFLDDPVLWQCSGVVYAILLHLVNVRSARRESAQNHVVAAADKRIDGEIQSGTTKFVRRRRVIIEVF